MAVIWSLVKEDYSFALTRIDTVYNLLVDAREGGITRLTPQQCWRERTPYIIIKDGVQHGARGPGVFLLQKRQKGQRERSQVQTWHLGQSFKIWLQRKHCSHFFHISWFAGLQSSQFWRICVLKFKPWFQSGCRERKAHFLERDCRCWTDKSFLRIGFLNYSAHFCRQIPIISSKDCESYSSPKGIFHIH